ncbi:hypothetical protein ACIQUY_04900 [Streptomyces sp. NPDC090231]|uniref:hypothetical protein n=1 Tax=unclassified Streptomyces TaxID=2593676 RepID=UPI0037FAA1DC
MTVEELMHALNALPLSARHCHVMALNPDSAEAFDFNSLKHEPDEEAVWITVGLL